MYSSACVFLSDNVCEKMGFFYLFSRKRSVTSVMVGVYQAQVIRSDPFFTNGLLN